MNLVPAVLHVLGDKAMRAVVVAAFMFVGALQVHRLDDGDTWWHLASGRLIAEQGAIARSDPFSYTAAGAPWVNRQWLFDLIVYGAWRAGATTGPILLAGALFLAGFAALFVLVRRSLPTWAAAVLLLLAASCAVERFAVRPEAVTFCFLALYLLVLERRTLHLRHLAWLVGLQTIWANCHALSVLGLVALGAELGGSAAGTWLPLPGGWRAASRREPRTVGWLALATACAIGAEFATPFGVTGALFPLRLLGVLRGIDVTSSTIVEHRPLVLGELSPQAAFGLVSLLALAGGALLLSVRRWRISHVLLALVFVGLGCLARRNVALVGAGVLPLIAAGFGPAMVAADRWLVGRRVLHAAARSSLVVALGIATASVISGRYYEAAHLSRTFGVGESRLLFPSAAVDFLDAQASAARVFNDDALGGYLLWRGYPRRRVFIDGRLQVYPPEVYAQYQAVLDDPRRFADVADRYGIGAAILYHPAPGRLELAGAIAHLPGWRVAYLDAGGVVLLADGRASSFSATTERVADSSLLERALGWVRLPIEDAVAHYQRGRALLYLFGSAGREAARAEFEAALRTWPDLAEAKNGLAAVDRLPHPD